MFEWWFRPWLRRNLTAIHLAGLPAARAVSGAEPAIPLILVANHTSWFDGFLLREIHRHLRPHTSLRTLMLQRELAGNPVLRWIGGCGFDPERPLTLRRAVGEVQAVRPHGLTLSFFPQGKIYPSTKRPLGFARGVEGVLRRLHPAVVLPVGLHLEMGNRVRPTAWIAMGSALRVVDREGIPPAPALEAAVERELDRIHHHLAQHGEAAAHHWPPVMGRPQDDPRHPEAQG
jgi:1-acyl-sn-glycerol-3-phosphate acyltransferase